MPTHELIYKYNPIMSPKYSRTFTFTTNFLLKLSLSEKSIEFMNLKDINT